MQQAHYVCEAMLKESVCELCVNSQHDPLNVVRSGITCTSVREGIYAEAFPLSLNYFLHLRLCICQPTVPLPFNRALKIAEATANLRMRGGHENELVLLTGAKAVTLADLVGTVNAVTGRGIVVERMPIYKFMKGRAENDEGGKSE